MTALRITPLELHDFPAFAAYLDDHVSDNGAEGSPLFQPMARADCRFDGERAAGFRRALAVELAQPGWRRAWVAWSDDGRIAGHVDLRGHAQPYSSHRCVLGIGVHRDCRQSGLGHRLLDTAVQWAQADASMAWIDLQVIASNHAAVRLYERVGFQPTGLIEDCFRFDGRSVSYLSMTLRLR